MTREQFVTKARANGYDEDTIKDLLKTHDEIETDIGVFPYEEIELIPQAEY